MFSYSPFHTSLFARQPCIQFEVSTASEFLKFTDIVEFFFVSHPASGRKEGREHERLMYFYPEDKPIDYKTDVAGLAEAVVGFTSSFVDPNTASTSLTDYDYRYISSTNTCEIVLIVENGNFFIGTCLNRKACKLKDYVPHLATIKAFLIKVYESFRLFYGPLTNLFNVNLSEFKKCLSRFFTIYLTLLHVNKIPLVDLFSGVDFMPLSNVDYLEVECLVSRCVEEFSDVQWTLFLFQGKLIQYSVDKSHLIAINQFLAQNLIPFSLQSELQPETASRSSRNDRHKGSFISGIVDFLGELSPSGFPIIYLSTKSDSPSSGSNYCAYELIAYHVLNATLCVIVPFSATNRRAFLNALADFLDERVYALASRIADAVGGQQLPIAQNTDTPFNFIYYNPDSLSLRSSFSSSISFAQLPSTSTVLPISIHKLIYETYDHFAVDPNNFAQVYVKADNDWWIVFKKMNRRILLLLIPLNATATITDVYERTDEIVKSMFKNIFIS